VETKISEIREFSESSPAWIINNNNKTLLYARDFQKKGLEALKTIWNETIYKLKIELKSKIIKIKKVYLQSIQVPTKVDLPNWSTRLRWICKML
jgi:hypothetical protein